MSLRPRSDVQERLRQLQSALPDHKVMLVGGAVRELARDHEPKDYDVEVLGLDHAELGAYLEKLWPGNVTGVGRAFAVYKVNFREGFELDISANPLRDFGQAARRRDFTMNSIGWDVETGEFVDPFEGRKDLELGLLRCVDPATFVEDPLRVYRAAQFAARFGFQVEQETSAVCQRLVAEGALDDLPVERVSEEWKKLLEFPAVPSVGLKLLSWWGLTARKYPELEALRGVVQDVRWHPEGDVWVHTLLVLDTAARLVRERPLSPSQRRVVLFGALLHDLGKPATTRVEVTGITAHGHEMAGHEPASAFLRKVCLGEDIELGILECVTQHMRPGALAREVAAGRLSPRQSANALRRLIRDVQKAGWDAFITLCEADKRGRGLEHERNLPYEAAIQLNPLLEYSAPAVLAPESLLKGRDLIALGVKPGPAMGKLIALVEAARDEGTVADHAEALAWLKDYLAAQSGQ